MSRAAMSLTAGFVFVLAVSGIQGQNNWGVTYTSTQICALKGSTVDIRCTYTYPSRMNDLDTTVEKTFWFITFVDNEPMDLRADSQYAGRVQYHCSKNSCTMRITDLRKSDSAVYKFSFITNQPGGKFIDQPGVTLSVTELQVITSHSEKLTCHSSCSLPGHTSYIWYKNEKIIKKNRFFPSDYYNSRDTVSCAVKGYEDLPAPSVCVHGDSCTRVTYTQRSICAFKGSSVDISCTYKGYYRVHSKFWFSPEHSNRWRKPSQPEDLSKDSQYSGRIQVFETVTGRSTLRIADLRETDSAQYHFTFITPISDLPGTTLTVTDPHLQVQVIWSSVGPKLVCHSSCLPPGRSFVWYKNEKKIQEETSPTYSGYVDPADSYSCAVEGPEGYHSLPVFGPKAPLVLKSNTGDIMKDTSVSLTCSSDANPAAKYSWYKNQKLLSEEPQLVFISIQSSDSGDYYCAAENELGRRRSEHVLINVKYGPRISNISVSPSGEIVEGSSVTLTCSTDANPAANYTWYKKNQTLLQGPEGIYHFAPISSKHTGIYHCKSENQYRQINSTSLFLDVHYAPKLPSVSVSPSGEIVEGSSVNLTCSTDAKPAANYTWYKENEDSPKASGQIFTITDVRPEHSGNYYCEAQNTRGRHSSAVNLILAASALKSGAIGTITAVLFSLIFILAVFLWRRRKKSFAQQCRTAERPDSRTWINTVPVYDTPSSAALRQPAGTQNDPHYSTICFSQSHTDAVYSNIRSPRPHRQTQDKDEDENEQDGVEYTAVRCDSDSTAPGTRNHEEDSFALYSTVNKDYENT